MKKISGKNIAFFEPDSDFWTNPSLICLFEQLSKENNVDIFMPVTIRYPNCKGTYSIYSFPHKILFWDRTFRSTLVNWKRYILGKSYVSQKILKNKKYDFIFGINSEGIVQAYNYAFPRKIPYIYLSYEIFFRDEMTTRWEFKEKETEIAASKRAAMVVIQDKWRAKLLAEENNIPQNNFCFLPVSPRGLAKTKKSDYLRKKFTIPDKYKIVIHSGSFENWTYAQELINSLPNWVENIILVVHTRHKSKGKHTYIERLKQLNSSNVIISTDPLDYKEYEEMLASADIGLVLYKENSSSLYLQKNIRHIGLSSGKFSYYAKNGLPIVSVSQESYDELLKEYNFGINLDSFSDIPYALEKIISNYQMYTKGAIRLFAEKLTFDIYWPEIENKISSLL